ncbi:MAG: hypothetical protein LBK44_03430, partial [Spirochaetales bacterium]|nr:hypothetical protein [Spirochaetales bacterium]
VFFSLSLLKNYICSDPRDPASYLIFAIVVLSVCILYIVFYIISEGIIKQMLVGFVISIAGMLIAAIFPLFGIVLAIIGVISMVKQIISFVQMIPLLLLGAVVCLLLFASDIVYNMPEYFPGFLGEEVYRIPIKGFTIQTPLFVFPVNNMVYPIHKLDIPYFILSFLISMNLSFKYSLKNALLRVAVIFLSIPIMIAIFYIVKSMLSRPLLKPNEIQQAGIHSGKIYVQPYMRMNGTLVSGYWRSVL